MMPRKNIYVLISGLIMGLLLASYFSHIDFALTFGLFWLSLSLILLLDQQRRVVKSFFVGLLIFFCLGFGLGYLRFAWFETTHFNQPLDHLLTGPVTLKAEVVSFPERSRKPTGHLKNY